jgi:hypothetical protein
MEPSVKKQKTTTLFPSLRTLAAEAFIGGIPDDFHPLFLQVLLKSMGYHQALLERLDRARNAYGDMLNIYRRNVVAVDNPLPNEITCLECGEEQPIHYEDFDRGDDICEYLLMKRRDVRRLTRHMKNAKDGLTELRALLYRI